MISCCQEIRLQIEQAGKSDSYLLSTKALEQDFSLCFDPRWGAWFLSKPFIPIYLLFPLQMLLAFLKDSCLLLLKTTEKPIGSWEEGRWLLAGVPVGLLKKWFSTLVEKSLMPATPAYPYSLPLPVGLCSKGSLGPSLQDDTIQECTYPGRKQPLSSSFQYECPEIAIPAWAQVSSKTEVLDFCFSSFLGCHLS